MDNGTDRPEDTEVVGPNQPKVSETIGDVLRKMSPNLDETVDKMPSNEFSHAPAHVRKLADHLETIINGDQKPDAAPVPAVASTVSQALVSQADDMERALLNSLKDQKALLDRAENEVRQLCQEMRNRGRVLGGRITEYASTARNIADAVRKARLNLDNNKSSADSPSS